MKDRRQIVPGKVGEVMVSGKVVGIVDERGQVKTTDNKLLGAVQPKDAVVAEIVSEGRVLAGVHFNDNRWEIIFNQKPIATLREGEAYGDQYWILAAGATPSSNGLDDIGGIYDTSGMFAAGAAYLLVIKSGIYRQFPDVYIEFHGENRELTQSEKALSPSLDQWHQAWREWYEVWRATDESSADKKDQEFRELLDKAKEKGDGSLARAASYIFLWLDKDYEPNNKWFSKRDDMAGELYRCLAAYEALGWKPDPNTRKKLQAFIPSPARIAEETQRLIKSKKTILDKKIKSLGSFGSNH